MKINFWCRLFQSIHATSKVIFPEMFCHKKYFLCAHPKTYGLFIYLLYGPIGIRYVSSLVFILYPLNINGLFFFLQLCLPNGNGGVRKCECFGGSCTLIVHDSNLYGNIGSNRVQLIMESQGRHSMHLFIFNNSSISNLTSKTF